MNYLINRMLQDLESGLQGHDIRKFIAGKPYDLSEDDLSAGILMVKPITTDINVSTTGLRDEETMQLQIIIAVDCKKLMNHSAVENTGDSLGMKIMEGRDYNTGELLTNTVRYIVRNNFRTWGLKQNDCSIIYDSAEYPNNDVCYTATMNLTIENQISQVIS